MKNFTMILAFMLFATISTKATVWIVNNNSANNSAANFTSLQAAVDSASVGDTLYVSGSPLSYGYINVDKQLVFIGEGYHHIGGKYSTTVSTFYLKDKIDDLNQFIRNANGCVFTGFDCSISSSIDGISNISIIRNKVSIGYKGTSSYPATNWIIINNIISYLSYNSYASYSNNFLILNNIFNTSGSIYISGAIIKNNLFFKPFSYSNNTISNNIFYGVSPTGSNNSSFKNNLSYASGKSITTNFDFSSNNIDTNNVENQDPKFVDMPATTSPDFNYAHDYHLQSTSPAIGAGVDGTDIGIYGGNYPFPYGGPIPMQTSAVPAIPQITDLEITNTIVPIDSALHINLKARIRN